MKECTFIIRRTCNYTSNKNDWMKIIDHIFDLFEARVKLSSYKQHTGHVPVPGWWWSRMQVAYCWSPPRMWGGIPDPELGRAGIKSQTAKCSTWGETRTGSATTGGTGRREPPTQTGTCRSTCTPPGGTVQTHRPAGQSPTQVWGREEKVDMRNFMVLQDILQKSPQKKHIPKKKEKDKMVICQVKRLNTHWHTHTHTKKNVYNI